MTNRVRSRTGRMVFAAAMLMGWGKPNAVPLYYSFSGEIVYSNVASYGLGRTVNYTFLVDQDLDGYTVDGDGHTWPVGDYSEAKDWFTLSFYSAYVGGDALKNDNPASPFKESSYGGV